jgi:hypothetical protein
VGRCLAFLHCTPTCVPVTSLMFVRPHAVQFLSQQRIFTASEYAALPPPSVSQTDFLLINWPIFERVLALDCVLAPNYLNSRQVTVLCAN